MTTRQRDRVVTACLVAILLVFGLAVATATGALGATTPRPTYALGHAKRCNAHYVKRTERHKVNGKEVRYVACVYVAPNPTATYALGHAKTCSANFVKKTLRHTVIFHGKRVVRRYVGCVYVAPRPITVPFPTGTTVTVTPTPVTTTPTTATTVTAKIDPSYTLPGTPQAPPVPVTFTYSASDVGASSLPDGELTLNIYSHGSASASFGCQTNVSGSNLSTDSATCTANLLAWGSYDLITSYSSGVSNVATTGQTDTVDIEPPAPSATSVAETWGSGATISGTVSGSTAALTLSDANFQGAQSVTLTDQRGDSCSANVSRGTSAACSMSLTGQPSSFTIAYPGGTSTSGTQTYSGWGIAQTQAVTFTWPSESVSIASPSITGTYIVYAVTVGISQYRIYNGSTRVTKVNSAPSSPLSVPTGDTLTLYFTAAGNYPGDTTSPAGSLGVTSTNSITGTNGLGSSGAGSADCSAITNLVGTTNGAVCSIAFSGSGTYPLVVGYASGDTNYPSQSDALSLTVDVS